MIQTKFRIKYRAKTAAEGSALAEMKQEIDSNFIDCGESPLFSLRYTALI
jgi:hypothetical protein